MKQIMVTKKNGQKEPFNPDKIHQILFWATRDISGVSVSQIETKAELQLYPGIPTDEIHEILIAAAGELISEDTPNYQWVAAHLRLFQIRKQALGQYEPIPLYDFVKKNVSLGVYTPELLEWYTPEEYAELDSHMDHDRDYLYAFAGIEQLKGKYLVQNRVTKQVYETPQYLNMLVAAVGFHRYPRSTRLKFVKDFYDAVSKFTISLPTPVMAGLRTRVKQFSSCVLIESGDSLASINATSNAIVDYISRKAGIGIHAGRIRAIGSPIRGGDAKHTGVTPFFKMFQAAVKSCSQGGVRGGAATIYLPIWHLEIENVLTLKSNARTEETAVRHVDYGIQFSGLFYERLIRQENITLFSPHEVTDMHDAFFSDQTKFRQLYEQYEKKPGIMKKSVPAAELFEVFHTQRKETGRIYSLNVDHANEFGSFDPAVAPITMSNLCLEITLPVKAMEKPGDESGEIALCTLSAINLGQMKKTSDFQKPADLLVRFLNEILDYQEYPVHAAHVSTMGRRPLGVGIINTAYWLAKNGYKYSDDSGLVHFGEMMESMQYYLMKSSMELAKERGAPCSMFSETKYSKGIMPIDAYKKSLDEILPHVTHVDWDWLRKEILTHGMLNSTLTAFMPAETSAQLSNSTNGFEPPRSFVSVKGSAEGRLKQVVPGFPALRSKYELAWDMPQTTGYLKLAAVAQKYVDQAISANTWYNPENFPGGKIPMSQLMRDHVLAYKYGLKTLYYCNTYDGQSDEFTDGGDNDCSPEGGCKL